MRETVYEVQARRRALAEAHGFTAEPNERGPTHGPDHYLCGDVVIWPNAAQDQWTRAVLRDGRYQNHRRFPTLEAALEG